MPHRQLGDTTYEMTIKLSKFCASQRAALGTYHVMLPTSVAESDGTQSLFAADDVAGGEYERLPLLTALTICCV